MDKQINPDFGSENEEDKLINGLASLPYKELRDNMEAAMNVFKHTNAITSGILEFAEGIKPMLEFYQEGQRISAFNDAIQKTIFGSGMFLSTYNSVQSTVPKSIMDVIAGNTLFTELHQIFDIKPNTDAFETLEEPIHNYISFVETEFIERIENSTETSEAVKEKLQNYWLQKLKLIKLSLANIFIKTPKEIVRKNIEKLLFTIIINFTLSLVLSESFTEIENHVQTISVKKEKANLYRKKHGNSKIISTLLKGNIVEIVQLEKSWVYVITKDADGNDIVGWIKRSSIEPIKG